MTRIEAVQVEFVDLAGHLIIQRFLDVVNGHEALDNVLDRRTGQPVII